MKLTNHIHWLCLAICLPILTGCASWRPQDLFSNQQAAPPEKTYEQRKAEAVTSFEKHREQAGVQAAVSTWERGDVEQAHTKLLAIVARSPNNVTARLRLAEILAFHNETSGAETHLRECLALEPNNAEAQHALGMLLSDWPGREAEGLPYLKRAVELEPQNAAYAAVVPE